MKPLIGEKISTFGWWVILGFALASFISGMMAGVMLMVWGATQIADHVRVEKVEVGFNETAAIDYMFKKMVNVNEEFKTMRLLGACNERYPEGGFALGCGENLTNCQCADGSYVS